MVQNNLFDAWVGSDLGLLKGVNFCTGSWTNHGDLKTLDKSQGISFITKAVSTSENQLLLGLKDGSVKTFDTNICEYTSTICCGESPVRGIVSLPDCSTLTCCENGLLKHWKDNKCEVEKKIGSDIQSMVTNSTLSVFATGGRENDLKIWKPHDLEKPIFTAKNVRNDSLNLRVPVWVSSIAFFKDSENEIVAGSGHHKIRVYDTRVKRRPVVDFEFHEYPITALSLTSDNKSVIVGNSASYMAHIDLRTGRQIGSFKGNCGSIRDISCHASQPLVVACGLDRFLKFYDLTSRNLLKKVYLKSNLNCVLLTDDEIMLSEDSSNRKRKKTATDDGEDDDDGSEGGDENIWEKMEVIKERKKKKNEIDED